MKKTLTAALAGLAFSASAQINTAKLETCKAVESYAKSTATMRQDGYPASGLLRPDLSEDNTLNRIAVAAFDMPRFSDRTPVRNRMIEEFASAWFIKCLKGK